MQLARADYPTARKRGDRGLQRNVTRSRRKHNATIIHTRPSVASVSTRGGCRQCRRLHRGWLSVYGGPVTRNILRVPLLRVRHPSSSPLNRPRARRRTKICDDSTGCVVDKSRPSSYFVHLFPVAIFPPENMEFLVVRRGHPAAGQVLSVSPSGERTGYSFNLFIFSSSGCTRLLALCW